MFLVYGTKTISYASKCPISQHEFFVIDVNELIGNVCAGCAPRGQITYWRHIISHIHIHHRTVYFTTAVYRTVVLLLLKKLIE